MKYAKSICCAVALFVSWLGFAASETVNGVTWYYSVESGKARVNSASPTSGTIIMPSKLGGYDVTSIATNAFRSCGLVGVTIGDGVLTIGNSAFRGCSRLTNVTIPNSVTTIENFAFAECSNLETVTIPDSVNYIGPSAFASCSGLTHVSVGTGVTRIGSYAFRYCSQLVAVEFEGNRPSNIGSSLFDGVASDCCAYVPRNSSGWGVSIPGDWMGIKINWAQYMVRFNANGGTCATSSLGVERGKAIGELPVPVRESGESSTFLGWFTAVEGGEEVTRSTVVNSDMTVYAHWGPVWRYNANSDGTAAFAGYSLSEGTLTIPSEIDGHPIVAIAANAFYGCSNLTSVTIPNTVTNIGDSAFYGCSGLGDMTIPESVANIGKSVFGGCNRLSSFSVSEESPFYKTDAGLLLTKNGKTLVAASRSLTNVVIPEGVEDIVDCAFSNCSGLTNVTLPDSMASIGMRAFSGCGGLESVAIPNAVTNVMDYAFEGCGGLLDVTIPQSVCSKQLSLVFPSAYQTMTNIVIVDGVTSIGDHAFEGCGGLAVLAIPDSVTNIGDYAFSDCNGLVGVTIPNGVRRIGSYAFYNCKNLTGTMTIPDGVESIEDLTFCNCIVLTGIAIPNSVTNIGISAFRGCKSLPDVAIPRSVTRIGATAFYGCGGLRSVNVTDIAAWCNITFGNTYANPLRYARNLYLNGSPITGLTIPDGVTNIGSNSFYNCTNLLHVTIPSGVREIGSYSFYGCSGLTSVTIPDSVTNIGNYAFYSCLGLTEMTFCGNAPLVGTSVFTSGSSCIVYVRQSSTGWGVTIPGRWNGIAIDYVHHVVTMDATGGTCETAFLDVRDGSLVETLPVPTRENAFFLGWFTEAEGGEKVNESLVVTEAVTLYAHWLTEVANPVIVSDRGSVFRADSCEVSITSETEGVTIYYTDDGTTPKRYDDYLYTGPITITDTTTFKAVAVVGGLKSGYTTVTVTKHNLTLDEALNVSEGVTLTTGAESPWRPVYDSSAKAGDATARSGAIGNRTNTWLSAVVSGAGTLSFWCKVSCEHDDDNIFMCDRLMLYTNGVEITDWRMDGESGWVQRELTFGSGENTVTWVYYKDKSDAVGEDCAWVDGVTWTPTGGLGDAVVDVGGGKSVTVPGDWLTNITERIEAVGGDVTTALQMTAANGRLSVVECYVLGLDPQVATNDFKIVSFPMKADGTPDLAGIVFDPPQAQWNVPATYKVKGAVSLEGPWEEVPAEGGSPGTARPTMRFFKVEVVLP